MRIWNFLSQERGEREREIGNVKIRINSQAVGLDNV